ncbi:3-oxoacyl-[acyl-carrier-protein] reductase FabG [Aquicella siphonis]|uniref:3-oxoacyl-[acyl-carrier-protein] reductase FabG n=1 Tax=Aquicella siphonis TaxID=254247 RepID=A0A5E4PKK8_9COXI|nr:pteridine reductase [Aquicella siphonis]VVC76756.1 3-oxoacyl-[acyl-carrier-protein] reductase FabG [Aquicella siphonis]
MQKNPLASKVALVTGSARRIGAEIARTLHQAGMNIVLHYNLSEEGALGLCQQLNHIREHSAVTLRADLLEAESEKILIQQALDAWGRLDALVNNASRFYSTPIGEVTEYAWDDLMNSNLKAPFFLCQAAASALAAVQGCIVNITDIHAERPLRNYSVYCISKSGLLMMTRLLAKELGPRVRVNAVAPGAILWPEGKNTLSEEEKAKIVDQTALQRAGSPEDIAKAVLFFIRDAGYVTGQVLDVDGGRGTCN